ncbi:MAG: HAD family hydrolase [Actinomycetota bacterium]
MSELKALIVDFGGVLTTPLQDAMVKFADDVGIELQDLVRAALGAYSGGEDDLVVGFETGKISEQEFAVAFSKRLSDISGKDISTENLLRRLFTLSLEEDMFTAVELARAAGFKTGLCSNSWGVELYPMERLEGLFDAIAISGLVGLRKPDVEMFRHIVDELGVSPEACVFVDDHPGHLKPALEEGMTTVLHRSPEETIAELERLLETSLRPPNDPRLHI